MSKQISVQQTCYTEGHLHYTNGGNVDECPYGKGSNQESYWVQGFWDAAQGKINPYN
jgi:ribosome modulation factor